MNPFELPLAVADRATRDRAVARAREARVRLPTFDEIADPVANRLPAAGADPDAPDPANLLRVHWHNGADRRGRVPVPGFVELPEALTGVPARIIVALGERFPMIGAHKVLAAYACLVVRLAAGLFDPTNRRAVWPSTGNYCRGGVAISRLMGCRGIAVLPEGMSRERFDWLGRWVSDPADIVRTPGTESNVKEIYDACAALARDPANDIINQFSEFANYVVHRHCTGRAMEKIFGHAAESGPARLAAFVASTGSAGTLAAGDYLKEKFGAKIVPVEPVECPTMLYNGYGAHNIQGIGDKHIPLIHNVMNSDLVVAVSDRATDDVNVLFNTPAGRDYLKTEAGVLTAIVDSLASFGISSICNVLAAIKVAKRLDLGSEDVILTVATDNASLYQSERAKALAREFPEGFDGAAAVRVFARHLAGIDGDHVRELDHRERRRIFNLGYFTWVEQQGVALADFDRRLDQAFWNGLAGAVPAWNELIRAFNRDAGFA
ncbi:MAG: pyridoxal-phosphate dependent enzyme [Rhodospirillales bacterium]|nr:pyridoxal-phosphate dependent enzyme [Rhodospirillales bacterium]